MPIGKGRDRRRDRRSGADRRDPGSTEAYEQSWYALLARKSDGENEGTGPVLGGPDGEADPDSEVARGEPKPQLATVKELAVRAPESEPKDPQPARGPVIELLDAEAEQDESAAARRAAEPTIRIGVRRLEDPGSVYLRYLTTSPHRDFFRSKLWPASRSITPVHLWRANHLGAGWDLEQVDRFMDVAVGAADVLIASAPRSAPPGSAERRAWIDRFLSAEWVREFGIARISKTVFATLPDLVPDLDPTLTSWARSRWLGLPEPEDAEEADRCTETWELLEDVLVLRSQQLGRVARRLRRLVPGLAPIGSLGLILAAFWDDLRTETDPERVPRRAPRRSAPHPPAASQTRAPAAGSPTADATMTRASRSAKAAPRSTRKPTGAATKAPRRSSAKPKPKGDRSDEAGRSGSVG